MTTKDTELTDDEMVDAYHARGPLIDSLRAVLAAADRKRETAEPTPESPFNRLKELLQKDPEYAWGWHCNLACCAMDEGLEHSAANRSAARFMRLCFDVDMNTHPHYLETQTVAADRKRETAGPVAVVVNNNQPGDTCIVQTPPNVSLDIGTELYASPVAGMGGCSEQEAQRIVGERNQAQNALGAIYSSVFCSEVDWDDSIDYSGIANDVIHYVICLEKLRIELKEKR